MDESGSLRLATVDLHVFMQTGREWPEKTFLRIETRDFMPQLLATLWERMTQQRRISTLLQVSFQDV